MAKVMIRCTETNEPVYTGISIDESAFESSELSTESVSCPHCGQKHTWDKDDPSSKTSDVSSNQSFRQALLWVYSA